MMMLLVLLVDRPWTLSTPGLRTWGALFGLAVLSTAVSYIIYFRLLASAGATNLPLVTFLIPVSALLAGDERQRAALTAWFSPAARMWGRTVVSQ